MHTVRAWGGGVCEVGDNCSPPDSGFHDAHLEESVNALSDSTPGLRLHDSCLCSHFTAACVFRTDRDSDFTGGSL